MKKNEINNAIQDIEDSVLELFELFKLYKEHINVIVGHKILSQVGCNHRFLPIHNRPDTLELHDGTIYYIQNGNIHSLPLTDELFNLDTDYMFNLYLLLDIKIFRSIVFCILEIKFFKFDQNRLYCPEHNHNRLYCPEHISEYIESKVNI